jgi:hypothetical protein
MTSARPITLFSNNPVVGDRTTHLFRFELSGLADRSNVFCGRLQTRNGEQPGFPVSYDGTGWWSVVTAG